MAKTIKPIICPTCGSNQKTEVKPEYFICKSCQTEYYLDSDDIHIIHTNKPANEFDNGSLKKNKNGIIAVVLITFILFIFFVGSLTNSISSSSSIGAMERNIDLSDDELILLKTKGNELIYANAGIEQTGDYENRKEKLVVYYDDSKGKNIKKQEIDFSIPRNKSSSSLRKKYFSNGDCYVIFNNKTVFKIDADLLEMREMSPDFFNVPELANGIAKIEDKSKNDAFEIVTMDGKSYIYFPIIKKVYTPDQFRTEKLPSPPNAINTTIFRFKDGESSSQLIKYQQKIQYGYPIANFYFTTRNEELFFQSSISNSIDFEYFIPDRNFFNARILGLNKELLIIHFTLDANYNSSRQIQALDVKTGKIRWTFDCSGLDRHVLYFANHALSNSKITLIEANFGGLTIDNQSGKLISSIERR